MKRAQSIKKRWEMHRRCHDQTGHSELNFGRMSLEWYLKYCHAQHKSLCSCTGEPGKTIAKWLVEEVQNV